MIDRRSIINRLMTPSYTIDEFNFERLTAPPLFSLVTPEDVDRLRALATSVKMSSKPEEKMEKMDDIMRRRGFLRMGSGTNRLVYRHVENDEIVAKVAFDSIGMGDNPAEFMNQRKFKPLVTKVFEISPCGTIGIFERVSPITNREQFISVSVDIFEAIQGWFIGEYILADFGTEFFMNWGIRENFGPVLLDFPYIYELDGSKIFCNVPDENSPTGRCDGTIDYDAGYNFLYCTKCGAKYRAKELQKKLKKKELIVKKDFKYKGGYGHMGMIITGGSKNINVTIEGNKPSVSSIETGSFIYDNMSVNGSSDYVQPNYMDDVARREREAVEAAAKAEEVKQEVVQPTTVEKPKPVAPVNPGLSDLTNALVAFEEALKKIDKLDEIEIVDFLKSDMAIGFIRKYYFPKKKDENTIAILDIATKTECYAVEEAHTTSTPEPVSDVKDEVSEDEEVVVRSGYDCISAKTIKLSEVVADAPHRKVFALVDPNGEYITCGEDNSLMVVDKIDEYDVKDIAIISESYWNTLMKELEATVDDVEEAGENKPVNPLDFDEPEE